MFFSFVGLAAPARTQGRFGSIRQLWSELATGATQEDALIAQTTVRAPFLPRHLIHEQSSRKRGVIRRTRSEVVLLRFFVLGVLLAV